MGIKEPDFTVNKDLMTDVRLSDYAGKVKLISVVPSVDNRRRGWGWMDVLPDYLKASESKAGRIRSQTTLFHLPGGRYTVGSKGNIRAFAAKACDVPWIYARVDAILPHKHFTVSTLEQIERSSSTEFRHGLLLGQLAQFALAAGFGRRPSNPMGALIVDRIEWL